MTSSVNSLKIYNSPGRRDALTLIASLTTRVYVCVCVCQCAGAEFAILVYGLVLCARFRFDCCMRVCRPLAIVSFLFFLFIFSLEHLENSYSLRR